MQRFHGVVSVGLDYKIVAPRHGSDEELEHGSGPSRLGVGGLAVRGRSGIGNPGIEVVGVA